MELRQGSCSSSQEFWVLLADIHQRHYHALVGLAALYLDGAGEDVVQDAFVGVWLRWDHIHDTDKVLVYLRRAVMNNAKSALRHRAVVHRQPSPVPTTSRSSEDVALGHLADEAVIARLRRLPARQRACAGLRLFLQLSEKETAEVLDISTGSVKQHTSRAMKKLARGWEASDG